MYVQFTPTRSGSFLSGVQLLERARVVAQEHMDDRGGLYEASPLTDGSAGLRVNFVDTAEDLRELLGVLARALEAEGASGELGGFRTAIPEYSRNRDPRQLFMGLTVSVSPRLREGVRDRPQTPGRNPVYWSGDIDPDVLDAVLAHALAWCDLPGGTHYQSTHMQTVVVDPGSREARWRWALREQDASWIACTRWPEQARRVLIDHDGRVTYQRGYGVGISPGLPPEWTLGEEDLAQAAQLLTDLAPWVDYGLVARHYSPWSDRDSTLDVEWPRLSLVWRPGELSWTRALDGERVPDAFGMQLLGPGHDLTGIDLTTWELTDLPAGRRLLTHHQPQAWFRPGPWRKPWTEMHALLITDTHPDPDVHARARQDLNPLFITGAEIDRERHHVQPSYQGVR